jgi:hypothetical protein
MMIDPKTFVEEVELRKAREACRTTYSALCAAQRDNADASEMFVACHAAGAKIGTLLFSVRMLQYEIERLLGAP